MTINLFDHFKYATGIIELIQETFPILNTVAFKSTPNETHFKDLGLPAFVMYYSGPEFLGDLARVDFDADDTYYMKIRLNVIGKLVLPDFAKANPDVDDDLNTHILLATAATNLAALIRKGGENLEAPKAHIESITYGSDEEEVADEYHRATLHWWYEAHVGAGPELTGILPNTLFNRFTIPIGGDTQPESHEVYPDRGGPEP